MSSSAHSFPTYLLNEIHQFPGNDRCCDCSSLNIDWASVSHGTLLCLECAGKHRSLGVSVSFVRSISMDTWTRRQVKHISIARETSVANSMCYL
ncbi:hypothetical protein EON65_49135 [archaeon]|nr:MAG: hypothetical protein EON65_49135 [archaeon]